MIWIPNETIYADFSTYSFTTGNLTTADAIPTVIAKKNGVLDIGFSWDVWNTGTGTYSCSGTVPAGYIKNDNVSVIATAVVAAVSGSINLFSAIIDTKRVSDLNDVSAADVRTEMDANSTKLDVAVSSRATSGTAMTLIASELSAIADEILKRDWNSVSGEASRSVLNALRILRNKVLITGDTLLVKAEDDSTNAWEATVSSTSGAAPITGVTPA